jgi:hypothetical protein
LKLEQISLHLDAMETFRLSLQSNKANKANFQEKLLQVLLEKSTDASKAWQCRYEKEKSEQLKFNDLIEKAK